MLHFYFKLPAERISLRQRCLLMISGFFSFIADTVGVGSFAVNIAFAKLFSTFDDDELPGLTNGAQVLPGAIEAFFFLNWIDVSVSALVTLILGACFGGLLGAQIIGRISQQVVRLLMIFAFSAVLSLLFCYKYHLLNLTGDLTSFSFIKLVIGFFAMMFCGALTSFGVGLFVSTQAVLFLMDISPLIAFPIMTAAGAIQQPLTTLSLLIQGKIPLRRTLIVSCSGVAGVLITLPLFTKLSLTWLHTLLMGIISYNIIQLSLTYFKQRQHTQTKIAISG